MPAKSKKQRKFMGMVHAIQKGETVKGASSNLLKAARSMKKSDAMDFASTKEKGLPLRVKKRKGKGKLVKRHTGDTFSMVK